MKIILTAISGSREGMVFTVEANECISFGRTGLSKWSFEEDGHMSSVHFEVANNGGRGEVRDRGSTNGTWLNNEKILTANLREGDRIRAGKTILTVEFSQELVPAELVDSDAVEQAQAPFPVDIPQPVMPPDIFPVVDSGRAATEPRFESLPRSTAATKVKKSNPFDSIDFEEIESPSPPDSPQNESSLPFADECEVDRSEKRSFSPISDSSDYFAVAQKKAARYELLVRRTTAEAADSFAIVLDTLKRKWSAQLVVHFQKVRIATPSECDAKPILRDFPNTVATSFLPVRLDWNDTNSAVTIPLLPRLCRSDACLAFFGRSAIEIGSQLDAMSSMGVEGFSEPNGFLPYYWPSCLISIVEARGKEVCDQLLAGRIAGVLMCAPFSRHEIFAITDQDLREDLLASEFSDIEQLRSE